MFQSNLIDFAILLFLLLAVARGLSIGFFRQTFSVTGFFIGLILASWSVPRVLTYMVDPQMQLIMSPVLVIVLAFISAAAGDAIGHKVRLKTTSRRTAKKIESGLGIFVSVTTVLVSAWLLAALIARLPIAGIEQNINQSFFLRSLNNNLPPAPNVIANIGRYVSPHGFPEVFLSDPTLSPTIPPSTPEVQSAAEKAIPSTVKVQGFGCGGIMTGSGFVVAPGLVATNAHVVAGMRRPVIYDVNGKHSATAIWFNPNLDLAVLRTSNLYGPPLPLSGDTVPRGTSVAVLGFPGGGNLEVDAAILLAARQALGRNIYDTSLTTRPIYEVQAEIEQGNSGGPVVLSNGSVAGMIFAKTVFNGSRSFAITSSAIQSELEKAQTQNQSVSTGRCSG